MMDDNNYMTNTALFDLKHKPGILKNAQKKVIKTKCHLIDLISHLDYDKWFQRDGDNSWLFYTNRENTWQIVSHKEKQYKTVTEYAGPLTDTREIHFDDKYTMHLIVFPEVMPDNKFKGYCRLTLVEDNKPAELNSLVAKLYERSLFLAQESLAGRIRKKLTNNNIWADSSFLKSSDFEEEIDKTIIGLKHDEQKYELLYDHKLKSKRKL